MSAKSGESRPFPIQLEVEFLDRLTEPVRAGKAKSVSEIIRGALARFDLSKVIVVRPPQVLISVRLPTEKREELRREAAAKHTSVGQLVRAAVEAFLPQIESGAVGQMEMDIETAPPPAEKPERQKSDRPSRSKPTRPAKKARAKASRPTAAKPAKPAKPPVASRPRPGPTKSVPSKRAPR